MVPVNVPGQLFGRNNNPPVVATPSKSKAVHLYGVSRNMTPVMTAALRVRDLCNVYTKEPFPQSQTGEQYTVSVRRSLPVSDSSTKASTHLICNPVDDLLVDLPIAGALVPLDSHTNWIAGVSLVITSYSTRNGMEHIE